MANLDVFSASAGSGKTFTLARKVIDILVRNPAAYAHTLAVTFTNKATAEMKERIVGDLFLITNGADDDQRRRQIVDYHLNSTALDEPTLIDRCKSALRYILYDFSHFSVSTIDHFVLRVLRSFAYEQGLTANYAVSVDTEDVIDAAYTDMMESLADNQDLCGHLIKMSEANLEEKGVWGIESGIMRMAKPLLSDKGDNFKIGTLNLDDFKKLEALLKKREAEAYLRAYELAKELDNGVKTSGINGFRANAFTFLDGIQDVDLSDGGVVRQKEFKKKAMALISKLSNPRKDLINKTATGDVDKFKAFLEGVKSRAQELACAATTAKKVRENIGTMAVMSSFACKAKDVQDRNNIHIISTSGALLRDLIDDCPIPFIYEKTGSRFDTIMIDEFQDTSRVQYENFEPLLRNSLAQGHDCLIVGDVKQSIYRFREGDWRLLGQRLEADFSEARHRPLSDNFRSRSEIVRLNNAIFAALPSILDSALPEAANPSDTMAAMYAESRQTPRKPAGGFAKLEILSYKEGTENLMKEIIDGEMLDAVRFYHDVQGYSYSDICVLVRQNKGGANVISRLSSEGIPVMSADSLFVLSSDATCAIVDAMRFVATGETVPLFSAVRVYAGVDDISLLTRDWETYKAEWGERFEALRDLGVVEMAGELVNLLDETVRNEQMPYIDAFLQRLRDSIANGASGLDAFLRLVRENGGKWTLEASSGDDAVRVMTIHKAKGLEFKVVMIPYANVSLQNRSDDIIWVPAEKLDMTDDAWRGCKLPVKVTKELSQTAFATEYAEERRAIVEDELNTLYVALTRPTDVLLAWASTKEVASSESVGYMGRHLCKLVKDFAGAEGFHKTEDTMEIENGDKPVSVTVLTLSCGTPPKNESPRAAPAEPMPVRMAHLYRPSASPSINTEVEMGEYERREDMISYGLTMHGIMQSVDTSADLHGAVEAAVTDGLVLPADAPRLEAEMSARMTNPRIAPWFDGSMTDVWAETAMVGPDRRLRPDRIMRSAEGETVVVDYKFGRFERSEHVEQVRQYKAWLADAGFGSVRAYLWYYTLDKVVEVE
ncbi:MAG: UvrD-helicase domain-containing protein [Bacteroidales bacterium]|nr:UvrD-helicase domain-containing protein [Bacteroidales bacterium]